MNSKAGFPSIEDYNNKEYAHRHGVDFTYNIKRTSGIFRWEPTISEMIFQGERKGMFLQSLMIRLPNFFRMESIVLIKPTIL
ncbi:hypothetical protein AAY42_11470 [Flagellimonas eckloniae]|uniref:Uncharacterized protein n=1 Tax=Flagellimonas eckloniae TaxID=346185 RepID=A0A0Q0WY57_9FLAO|nr:hypothetical protein AAY42_11470 [Allomuricauda eckloniae]